MLTNKWAFVPLVISVNGHSVSVVQSLRYLCVIFDRRRRFYSHIQDVAARAARTAHAVARLMLNVSGPSAAKRHLLTMVVTSKLPGVADVWGGPALTSARSVRTLNSAIRAVAIRVTRAYTAVSMEAALVLAAMILANVLAEERKAVGVRLRT